MHSLPADVTSGFWSGCYWRILGRIYRRILDEKFFSHGNSTGNVINQNATFHLVAFSSQTHNKPIATLSISFCNFITLTSISLPPHPQPHQAQQPSRRCRCELLEVPAAPDVPPSPTFQKKLQRRASLIRGVLTAEAPVLAAVQPPRLLRPQPSVDVVQGSHRPCHLQPPPPPPAFGGIAKIAAIKLHCTKENVLFGDFVIDHYSSLLTNWGSHWSYTGFGCRVYTSAS
ncbi:hypothetical protein PIB30_063679 [Stylosanthes scabra]|uniref:Uncharacterized protein n=1 Tax=Stylosanthes scabra TaxID=79078 RepID=A0ABU6TNV9_9FABA|nr:hypothetical protein [Stylosanthes scabra]